MFLGLGSRSWEIGFRGLGSEMSGLGFRVVVIFEGLQEFRLSGVHGAGRNAVVLYLSSRLQAARLAGRDGGVRDLGCDPLFWGPKCTQRFRA